MVCVVLCLILSVAHLLGNHAWGGCLPSSLLVRRAGFCLHCAVYAQLCSMGGAASPSWPVAVALHHCACAAYRQCIHSRHQFWASVH